MPSSSRRTVNRRQNAPVDGQKVRHEGDCDILAAEPGKGLLDLGGVAVTRDLVGVEALVELGEVIALSGLSARAGHAAFAVADYALGADKTVSDSGRDSQRRTGGVAAGVCDKALALDLIAEKLGQTVNALRVQLLVEEGSAVPFGVLVLAFEAEVRAEVDERLAGAHALCGELLRKTVGESREDDVALLDHRVLIFADHIV